MVHLPSLSLGLNVDFNFGLLAVFRGLELDSFGDEAKRGKERASEHESYQKDCENTYIIVCD